MAQRLLPRVLQEEVRLHGRRKGQRCGCTYCAFLPSYVLARVTHKRMQRMYRRTWSYPVYKDGSLFRPGITFCELEQRLPGLERRKRELREQVHEEAP